MRAEQFAKLARQGESVQIEYKTCTEKISDSLYQTVCSFLNHSGGHILVGVKNNGEIAGVNPDRAETLKTNIITSIKNQNQFLLSCKSISSDNKAIIKKRKRQQAIIGLINATPNITMEVMAEKLDVTERTIKRDIEELKSIIEHVGPTKGGFWIIVASKNQVP